MPFLVVHLLAGVVLASGGPYVAKLGFDISYPQCGQPTTPSGAFAIVGVNGGRPFSANSCFGTEFGNSVGGVGASSVSVYMNLSAPVGKTATQYTSAPQACGPGDKACQAQNYGWNAAAYAYQQAIVNGYSSSAGGLANIWWLDIETANSWSGRTDVNRGSIQWGLPTTWRRKASRLGFTLPPQCGTPSPAPGRTTASPSVCG